MPNDNDNTSPVEQGNQTPSPEPTPTPFNNLPNVGSTNTEQPGVTPITPTPSAAPTPVQAPNNAGVNGLGIAALVVGIVAFISGWIPFWGFLVGATAVVLGILALKKPGNKAMPIIGIIGGGLGALWGLIVSIVFVIALVAGGAAVNEAADQYNKVQEEQQALVDGKKEYAKGETARFGNFDVKINSVSRNYVSSNQFSKPADGKEFIVLNITVTNKSETTDYFSDFNLGVNDAGVTGGTAFVVGLEDEFDNGDVDPGASVTGNVPFEVTKDATDLKLQFTMTMIGGANSGEKVVYTLAI